MYHEQMNSGYLSVPYVCIRRAIVRFRFDFHYHYRSPTKNVSDWLIEWIWINWTHMIRTQCILFVLFLKGKSSIGQRQKGNQKCTEANGID